MTRAQHNQITDALTKAHEIENVLNREAVTQARADRDEMQKALRIEQGTNNTLRDKMSDTILPVAQSAVHLFSVLDTMSKEDDKDA